MTLPAHAPANSEKKITTLTDECGNVTEVEQVIVVQDNAPPIWLNAPDELIVTDNINGEVFDEPVAEDLCSEVVVNVTNSYGDGGCPLSVVLTPAFSSQRTNAATRLPPLCKPFRKPRICRRRWSPTR